MRTRIYFRVHGLKHLKLCKWNFIWLTNSPELALLSSFSTKENCPQFSCILVKYLSVATLHFHCLSLHQVNSDFSLSCPAFTAQQYFPFHIATAVLQVQTHPLMSVSCLLRSMWGKQFHDHSFTFLWLVVQLIYICSTSLVTGKTPCWGMLFYQYPLFVPSVR